MSVGPGVSLHTATPTLIKRSSNSFLDVRDPASVRETIMSRLVSWREAYQQQKIAGTLERMAGVPPGVAPSVTEELYKLKKLLDEGVITREEFEKLEKKLLEQGQS